MSSGSSDIPIPSHWRRSLVRSKTRDGKTKVELFLDNNVHPIRVPKESSSKSSSETIEVPRQFPPPTCICSLSYPPPPPPPPLPPVYLAPAEATKQQRKSYSSSSSPTSSDSIGPRKVLFSKSPLVHLEADSRQRLGLDGHSHSADSNKRRSRKRPRDIAEEVFPAHYCAKCGRSRSKRFQLENPIRKGVLLVPGICSRCEPTVNLNTEFHEKAAPRKGEREVEELLIRRSRPHRDPVIRVFQPRQYKLIRVIRRSRSSSPAPRKIRRVVQLDSSSCSDKLNAAEDPQPVRNARIQRNPNEATKLPKSLVKVRVRSRSSSSSDEEPVLEKLEKYDNGATDHKIASHPNAWSHVRVISKDPPPPRGNLAQAREHPRPRSRSPPEWFYRRHRTYIEPNRRPEVECWDRRGRIDEDTFERGAARARQFGPRKRSPSPERQAPLSGILNRPKRDEARMIEERDLDHFSRFALPCDEMQDSRRVKFANSCNGPNRRRAASRMKEAVDDWIEEKVDQRDFEKVKKRVREDVHEGAGALELDGHRSEDCGIIASTEDFHAYVVCSPESALDRDRPRSSIQQLYSAPNLSPGTARTLSESSSRSSPVRSAPGYDVEIIDSVELGASLDQSDHASEVSSTSGDTEFSESESICNSEDSEPRDALRTTYRRPEHLMPRHSNGTEMHMSDPPAAALGQDEELTVLAHSVARSQLSNEHEDRVVELAPDVSAFDSCGGRTTGTWEAESKVSSVEWNANHSALGEEQREKGNSAIGSSSDFGQTWGDDVSRERHEPIIGDW